MDVALGPESRQSTCGWTFKPALYLISLIEPREAYLAESTSSAPSPEETKSACNKVG